MDDDEAAEEVEDEEEEIQIGSSSCSGGGGDCTDTTSGVLSLSSSSSSERISPPRQLSSCSCITLSSIWRTRSFSGDRSSSSLSSRVSTDSFSTMLSGPSLLYSLLLTETSLIISFVMFLIGVTGLSMLSITSPPLTTVL